VLAARPLGLGAKLAKAAGLLAVLVAVVAGGPLVDAALLAPAGPALQVTSAVRLAPLGGWRLAAIQEGGRPALLTRGSGSLAVLSIATGLDQRQLADAYMREYLAPASANLVVTEAELVSLGPDRLARRFAYRGRFEGPDRHGGLAGEVTTVVSPLGSGVVFDAWAEADVYPYERGDAGVMVARAVVG
jgi:hypothetical protein